MNSDLVIYYLYCVKFQFAICFIRIKMIINIVHEMDCICIVYHHLYIINIYFLKFVFISYINLYLSLTLYLIIYNKIIDMLKHYIIVINFEYIFINIFIY